LASYLKYKTQDEIDEDNNNNKIFNDMNKITTNFLSNIENNLNKINNLDTNFNNYAFFRKRLI